MAALEVTIPFSSEVLEQSRVIEVTYENPRFFRVKCGHGTCCK